jgi:serine/threonine protein kinase/WD40 repeat protein
MKPVPDQEEALLRAAMQLVQGPIRKTFLEMACAGDVEKRQRLEALIAAQEEQNALPASEATGQASTVLGQSAQEEGLGAVIGRYKLLEKIGEGGFGAVYAAEQREPVKRRVALKLIKLGMDTRQVVARFEAERQALALMDHPNIAKVLDAGATDSGRPYFVMELVRGITITRYCDQENLSARGRLELFIQICHAIQHAHQKGIIHRDIKPSNILVTLHDGVAVPKVIDFGIAKATQQELTEKTVYTQLQQFIGTPAYMSPEQAEMSGLDIDTRSDIYSLGVLLYELLTGGTPFDTKELLRVGLDEMRRIIREREPVRPSTRLTQELARPAVESGAAARPENGQATVRRRHGQMQELIGLLRGDLDWIVMKCLEKDRARRYETANGLAMDLKRHLNHEPVVARPPSAAYRFQKLVRRNKLVFLAAGSISAALLIGVVVALWQAGVAIKAKKLADTAARNESDQRQRAEKSARIALEQSTIAATNALKAAENERNANRLLYAADINLAQQALKLNNLGHARRLLDRHRPKAGEEDLRGWEWRYLWQQTRSSALVTLTNRPARGYDVSFSPDGARLAVAWADGRVDLWSVPDRRFLRTLTGQWETRRAQVAFSPVRNLVAATSAGNAVTLYDLDSGQESTLWQASGPDMWDVRNLSFSSDGSRVVIYAGTRSHQIGDAVWVVNVSSGKIESRYPSFFSDSIHHGAARLSPDNQRLYLARSNANNYRYSIQCLDLATGKELWQTELQRDYGLTALAVSPDGSMLASGSGFEDAAIRIWNAQTGRLLARLDGHTGWVGRLVFSRDGRHLISAASDQTIRFWDASNWTETKVLRGHSDEVHAIAFSEQGKLVASAGKDGNLMLWQEDGKSGADGYLALPETYRNYSIRPLDQAQILLWSGGKTPELLDLKGRTPPITLPEIGAPGRVLGCFGTNILCYWNATNQILVGELRGKDFIPRGAIMLDPGTSPAAFTFNPRRQLVAWTERNSGPAVFVSSLTTPSRRTELKSDVIPLGSLRFSVEGNYLGAWGGSHLRAWQVDAGQMVASVDEPVRQALFAAGGRVLVTDITRGADHEISFYDLTNPQRGPRRFPGKEISAHLDVSPDGGLVAASTYGGFVLLFDAVKGELIESFRGHLNAVFGVAFSPDGRRLISADGGREAIKIWDVNTRQELLTLAGTGSFLHQAAWSADGQEIVAGTPWQVWHAPSWAEIATAEAEETAQQEQP